jgi:hypothetical protein
MADMPKSVSRAFSAVFGICAITWAVVVFPAFRAEIPLADTAQRILSGDRFNATQLGVIRSRLQGTSTEALPAPALSSTAVIRLLLQEEERVSNRQPSTTDIAELKRIVSAALAQSPTNSFMWLVDLSLMRLHDAHEENNIKLLRMSYWSGPNEAWIAVKRNPIALSVFSSLPSDLAAQAVSEFSGLVNARLYVEAADILAGPGWAIRDRLLARLAEVNEDHRRAFARALAAKDVEGVTVPGVSERPFHRF